MKRTHEIRFKVERENPNTIELRFGASWCSGVIKVDKPADLLHCANALAKHAHGDTAKVKSIDSDTVTIDKDRNYTVVATSDY